jgi:membrane-bound serine protease (ClpP class)
MQIASSILAFIADPNVAIILLIVGIYGILFELLSPGTIVPGLVGTICLILAFIAFSALPVHYGALALLLLGIGLMAGEAFTPGVGALGVFGLIAFVVGSLFLFESGGPGIDRRVSLGVIAGTAIACAGLSFFVLGAALRARNRPAVTGDAELIGSRATVMEWSGDRGLVRVHGEVWSARGAKPVDNGATVRVAAREGLVLTVEPQ